MKSKIFLRHHNGLNDSFDILVTQSNQFIFVYTVDMYTLLSMTYYTFESSTFVLKSCSVFELYFVSEAQI